MTSKRDHERDAELDKKIEALRRKNEALMKRYKVRIRAHNQRVRNELLRDKCLLSPPFCAEVGQHTSYSAPLGYVSV